MLEAELATMEITQIIRRRRGVVGPASVRAQILLVLSAFLCGTVLAALLFVGIWRHTAADGARAQAQQAQSRRLVLAARQRIATLTAQLEAERASVDTARQGESRARRTLVKERAALDMLDRSLPPRLQTVDAAARGLSARLSTLVSELAALQNYLRAPGAAGVDVGYLTAQARYLASSAGAASSAAATVVRESHAAAVAVSTVTRK